MNTYKNKSDISVGSSENEGLNRMDQPIISDMERTIEFLQDENAHLRHLVEYYEHRLRVEARKRFGASSERQMKPSLQ